jgi:myo-inositol-1(or 4)-monophosphatase
VYDPLRQELFTASRGSGAYLDNRRIRVSRQTSLNGALLGTGFPYKNQQHLDAYLNMFRALIADTAGIRRPGSAALDLAYVAAGRLDGFWELGLRPWDMAAGVLLIHEAGGLVGDLAGGHSYLENGNVVAATPKLFPAMLREIRPYLSADLER